MEISPKEAEDALRSIETISQKMRRSIAASGAYAFLFIWGGVWLLGFLGSQFLELRVSGYAWTFLDILGGLLSALIGVRLNRTVRRVAPSASGRRIAIFWLLLFIFCTAAILVAAPTQPAQFAMLIIIFVAIGWTSMGLLLSFASVWWGLGLFALAITGYFVFPGIFNLWMAVLGGGGMIALGIVIRNRW